LGLQWNRDRVQRRICKVIGKRVRMETEKKKGSRMTLEKVRKK